MLTALLAKDADLSEPPDNFTSEQWSATLVLPFDTH